MVRIACKIANPFTSFRNDTDRYLLYILLGILAERFGGKWTLGLGILSTAAFTVLTPITVERTGAYGLIVLRILMGLGEGTTFPALSALLASWVPERERSKIGSFVFGGGQVKAFRKY